MFKFNFKKKKIETDYSIWPFSNTSSVECNCKIISLYSR